MGGELREIPLRVVDMVGKELNVHGVRGATRNDQRVVAELLEKGRIRMPIHAVLPLAKAAEAHAMLEHSEDVVDRIVLHPWDDVCEMAAGTLALLPRSKVGGDALDLHFGIAGMKNVPIRVLVPRRPQILLD